MVCSKYAIKEQDVSFVLYEIRTNRHLRNLILRIVYKLFNDSILRGFLKILFLSVFFFLLKLTAHALNNGTSSLQIIGGPIMMVIEKII